MKIPITDKNIEYHKRVSPRVRNGGRSKLIHKLMVKQARPPTPSMRNTAANQLYVFDFTNIKKSNPTIHNAVVR